MDLLCTNWISVTCLKIKANEKTLSVEILYSGIKEIIYSSVNKVLPSDFRLSISKEPSLIFYSEWWKDDWTFIGSLVYFDKRCLYIWNQKKYSKKAITSWMFLLNLMFSVTCLHIKFSNYSVLWACIKYSGNIICSEVLSLMFFVIYLLFIVILAFKNPACVREMTNMKYVHRSETWVRVWRIYSNIFDTNIYSDIHSYKFFIWIYSEIHSCKKIYANIFGYSFVSKRIMRIYSNIHSCKKFDTNIFGHLFIARSLMHIWPAE